MSYFTTYDSLYFIEIARAGSTSSVQDFLRNVLGYPESDYTSVSSDMITKSRFILGRAKGILDAISDAPIKNQKEIVKNINKNLVSSKAIKLLFDELKKRISSAENIADADKEYFADIEDFGDLLFGILLYTLENQSADRKALKAANIPFDKERIFYERLQFRVDEIMGRSSNKDVIELYNISDSLEAVSKYIYERMFDSKSRFSENKIESDLLPQVSETLKTYGSYEGQSYDMSSFFEGEDNLLLLGRGGVGKTYLLANTLKDLIDNESNEYIPIFISLTKLKEIKYDSTYIKTEILSLIESVCFPGIQRKNFDSHTEDVYLTELLKFKNAPKKILLLLDGYNEISNVSSSVLWTKIQQEIDELSGYNNVRIILTSRPFYNSDESFGLFKHIYAIGISRKTVLEILDNKEIPIPKDSELIDLLCMPLFLVMYINNANRGVVGTTTKGAILYEYFNGTSSIYNEISLLKDPKFNLGNALPEFVPLIIDFIFPAMAATMEMHDSFSIASSQLADIIDKTKSICLPFDKAKDPYFKKYDTPISLSLLAIDLIRSGSDVQKMLTNRFAFVEIDDNDNISFTHQYIKDYFACFFRILTYRQKFLSNDDMYWDYAHSPLDDSTYDLAKEIADQSNLIDLDLLRSVFDSCPDKKDYTFIYNLLMMISTFNNGSLAGLNFVDFDLAGLPLYKFSFSNDKEHANFTNCNFSEMSFLTYESHHKILRTYSFYKGRPAMFELIINDYKPLFNIVDFMSRNIAISPEEWNEVYYNSLANFNNVNKMIISEDNDHIVLYDRYMSTNDFYVYVRSSKTFSTHYFREDMTRDQVYFCGNDKLLAVSDNNIITVYDLNYEEPDINPDSLKPDEELPVFDYKGIIDTYYINVTRYMDFEGDRYELRFISIYEYKNKFVLVYDSPSPSYTLFMYTPDEDKLEVIPLPVKATNHYFSTSACISGNLLYMIFYKWVFEIDLDTRDVREVYCISERLLAPHLSIHHNKLAIVSNGELRIIDIQKKDSVSTMEFSTPFGIPDIVSNNDFILSNNNPNFTKASYYRFDNNTIHDFDYDEAISIVQVLYLSHERMIVFYSSGYVALVNAKDMSLIKGCYLDKNFKFISADYNKEKEHFALTVCKRTTEKSINQMFIYDTSDDDLFMSDKLFYFEEKAETDNLCYSTNGKYLFANQFGIVYIYDTDTYEIIRKIKLDDHVEPVKAVDDNILIFHHGIPDITSDEHYVMIFDTRNDDLKSVNRPVRLINDIVDEYDDVFFNNLLYDLYEIVYPFVTDDYDKLEHPEEGYFHLDAYVPANESLDISDYYEDGILIKCSKRHVKHMPAETIKLNFMTTKFAHLDEKKNYYIALSKENKLVKYNILTGLIYPLNVIPGLEIKDCVFDSNKSRSVYIDSIITCNLGKISNTKSKF